MLTKMKSTIAIQPAHQVSLPKSRTLSYLLDARQEVINQTKATTEADMWKDRLIQSFFVTLFVPPVGILPMLFCGYRYAKIAMKKGGRR